MKKILAALFGAALLVAGGTAPAEVSVRSGARLDLWEDTRDFSGSQAVVPLRVEWSKGPAAVSLLAGFARTEVNLPGAGDRSLADLLDTKLNLSWFVEGKLPVDLLLGLDINLPTGRTDLPAANLVLIQDAEIAAVTSFGEGVNVNPTLSAVREWGAWAAGLGAGYAVRRPYDVSSEAGLADFDPGDVLSLNALVTRSFARGYTGRLFGRFCRFGKDRLGGADYFREGDYRMIGLGVFRSGAAWEADTSLRATFRGRTEIRSGGALVEEPNRSRGDEWTLEAQVRHRPKDNVALSASLRGLLVAKNGYPHDSPRFNGERRKISLSLGCDRTYPRGLTAGVSLSGFVLSEETQSLPVPRAERTTRGAALSFRIGLN